MVEAAPLTELERQANELHFQVISDLRTAIYHARDCGAVLDCIKKRLRHGLWEGWLDTNFEAHPNTARMYLRVYRGWGQLQAHLEINSKLSVNQALQILRVQKSVRSRNPDDRLTVTRNRLRQTFVNQLKQWSNATLAYLAEETVSGKTRLDESLREIAQRVNAGRTAFHPAGAAEIALPRIG